MRYRSSSPTPVHAQATLIPRFPLILLQDCNSVMAPGKNDKSKAASGAGKGKAKGKDDDASGGGKLKAAQSINVRHILVSP